MIIGQTVIRDVQLGASKWRFDTEKEKYVRYARGKAKDYLPTDKRHKLQKYLRLLKAQKVDYQLYMGVKAKDVEGISEKAEIDPDEYVSVVIFVDNSNV